MPDGKALSKLSLVSAQRSWNMSRIRGKDTQPEMIVRRLLHSMGYRYRLHAPELPGKPDIVFRPRMKAIFVHGCFWHRHPGCKHTTTPKSREEFWRKKFLQNMDRDRRNLQSLHDAGWATEIVWECETKNTGALASQLRKFLETVN
ncbi:very short patch repair endonuclease [Tateyamaria armeniaca]|uniref:Very short patch repair endonuclease n=1 Tax=Tateyamaria armeniaca TaxID=2518930 RepID=A0ABW8V2D9_9RHOB